jgi:hypothetical protein
MSASTEGGEKMSKVQRVANLAESTVQAIARGEVAAVVRRRRTAAAPRNGAVEVVTVDAEVMALARDLADGDMSRIEIKSATEVVVHNHNPRRRR